MFVDQDYVQTEGFFTLCDPDLIVSWYEHEFEQHKSHEIQSFSNQIRTTSTCGSKCEVSLNNHVIGTWTSMVLDFSATVQHKKVQAGVLQRPLLQKKKP